MSDLIAIKRSHIGEWNDVTCREFAVVRPLAGHAGI
jgi:hypothetical protein